MGELSNDQSGTGDYDIAILHERNAVLKERDATKSFQEEVDTCKSLADDKTRTFLANFPFYQRKEAFPLFTDGEESRDDSTDYQLHPHYTLLAIDQTAEHPHSELFRLSKDGHIIGSPDLVVGIGRLFVNARNGRARRTSKWTGYQVFVDKALAVWAVFDRSSHDFRAADWYPEPCELLTLQTTDDKQNINIACILSSLHVIEFAKSKEAGYDEFKKASRMVQETKKVGKMMICQVDRSETQQLLESGSSTPERLKLMNQEIFKAVIFGGRDAQRLSKILNEYKEDFSIIKGAITPRVVMAAADNAGCGNALLSLLIGQFRNEVGKSISQHVIAAAARNSAFGEKVMAMFVEQFKEQVRRSITPKVLKAAATNLDYGASLMEMICINYEDAVRQNVDIDVIHAAVLNGLSGLKILEMLFKADDKRLRQLCLRVLQDGGPGWRKQDRAKLSKMLTKMESPQIIKLAGGMGAQTYPSPTLQSSAFEVADHEHQR